MRQKMKLTIFLVLLITVVFSTNGLAEGKALSGVLEGTGRACSGKLIIDQNTLTWDTPFSQCQNVSYQVILHHQNDKEWRTVYKLNPQKNNCLFHVIVLSYNVDPLVDWQVEGYLSMSDYKQKNPHHTSCYLSRVNKHGYVIEGLPR